MSYHGANFPRRLTWEWAKNKFHYCLPLSYNIAVQFWSKNNWDDRKTFWIFFLDAVHFLKIFSIREKGLIDGKQL